MLIRRLLLSFALLSIGFATSGPNGLLGTLYTIIMIDYLVAVFKHERSRS